MNFTYDVKPDAIFARTRAQQREYADGKGGKGGKGARSVDPRFLFSVKFHAWHRIHKTKSRAEKEQFWETNRRVLPKDSLVCLLRQNDSKQWTPERFGIISTRESHLLVPRDPKGKQLIGLTFFSKHDNQETLAELAEKHSSKPTKLFIASASFFAYEPVLRRLQMMPTIPFAEELVGGAAAVQTDLYSDSSHQLRTAEITAKIKKLDESQRAAFECALTDRVSLIQGPPGTGKTHIGVLLCEAIIAQDTSRDATILCVCYTNHALDAFLEDLLGAGIDSIVRIGGRSKSERVQKYGLRELATQNHAFSREQSRRHACLQIGTCYLADHEFPTWNRVQFAWHVPVTFFRQKKLRAATPAFA